MHSGLRRVARVALSVFVLVLVAAVSAQAQSDRSTETSSLFTTTVHLDSAAVETPLASTERALASKFKPKLNATFLPPAQGADEDSGIGFGVLGMITRTSYRAQDLEDFYNSKTGWGLGVWVGGNRNGRVGFVGEFIYLNRKVTDEFDNEYITKALEIPAVFHVNFGSRSRNSVGGFVVVGPVFTINLKQEINEVDVSDNFNGADIGIIGGAGVEFFRITIEGRGNWGLRNINREGDVVDTKTVTFELLGKFAFN